MRAIVAQIRPSQLTVSLKISTFKDKITLLLCRYSYISCKQHLSHVSFMYYLFIILLQCCFYYPANKHHSIQCECSRLKINWWTVWNFVAIAHWTIYWDVWNTILALYCTLFNNLVGIFRWTQHWTRQLP